MPHITECWDDDDGMARAVASGMPLSTEEHHLGLAAEVNNWARWASAHSRIIEKAHEAARAALLNAQGRENGPVGYVGTEHAGAYTSPEHTPPIEIRQFGLYDHNAYGVTRDLVRFKVMFYYTTPSTLRPNRGRLIHQPKKYTMKKDVPPWLDRLITNTFMDPERPFRKRFDPALGLLGLSQLPVAIENYHTSDHYGVALGSHRLKDVEHAMFPRHLTPWVVHTLRMTLRPIAEEMILKGLYHLDCVG